MSKNINPSRRIIGVALAVALSACGGYSSPVYPSLPRLGVQNFRVHATRSWMKHVTSGQDLLYVADQASQNVDVFSFPQGRLVGTLTGFIHPTGECVDASGNVFIISQESKSSYFSSTVSEYAHGSTTPTLTLAVPSRAEGCAIDFTSGNLAVSGAYASGPYVYGVVAIFEKAQGDAKMYYSKTFPPFWLCGYDPQGTLYISGEGGNSGLWQLIRIARKNNAFMRIAFASPIYADVSFPSSVQWDGTYMTVSSANAAFGSGRYQPSYVYRLKISGSKATTVSTTTYTGKRRIMTGQVWISGNRLIASHYHAGGGVDFWSYPNAGKATVIVPTSSGIAPFGIALSNGSH